MAFFIEDDWEHACEKCIELLLKDRRGHTLVIHSTDGDVIRQFMLRKPVGRILVNTPATFGSMGASTNMFPAMTLGSGSSGLGITSDNVSPRNLIYVRKVGFGVRSVETADREFFGRDRLPDKPRIKTQDIETAEQVRVIQGLLREAVEQKN